MTTPLSDYPEPLWCEGCVSFAPVRTWVTAWCREGHRMNWPSKPQRPIDQIERIMRHAMRRSEWTEVLRLLERLEEEELQSTERVAAALARREEREHVFGTAL